MLDSFWPPWPAARQASLPFTISGSLLKLMCVEWHHPTLSPSVTPFSSCPQSFPASGSFPGGQSIEASASAISPSNDYSELGWLIWSPCCPRDSQESSPQFKSINSSAISLLYGPTSTSIHGYWKNHSFDYRHFCQRETKERQKWPLFFNMLSRFVITFLPRSNYLNFVAAVTISSDFWAQEMLNMR